MTLTQADLDRLRELRGSLSTQEWSELIALAKRGLANDGKIDDALATCAESQVARAEAAETRLAEVVTLLCEASKAAIPMDIELADRIDRFLSAGVAP